MSFEEYDNPEHALRLMRYALDFSEYPPEFIDSFDTLPISTQNPFLIGELNREELEKLVEVEEAEWMNYILNEPTVKHVIGTNDKQLRYAEENSNSKETMFLKTLLAHTWPTCIPILGCHLDYFTVVFHGSRLSRKPLKYFYVTFINWKLGAKAVDLMLEPLEDWPFSARLVSVLEGPVLIELRPSNCETNIPQEFLDIMKFAFCATPINEDETKFDPKNLHTKDVHEKIKVLENMKKPLWPPSDKYLSAIWNVEKDAHKGKPPHFFLINMPLSDVRQSKKLLEQSTPLALGEYCILGLRKLPEPWKLTIIRAGFSSKIWPLSLTQEQIHTAARERGFFAHGVANYIQPIREDIQKLGSLAQSCVLMIDSLIDLWVEPRNPSAAWQSISPAFKNLYGANLLNEVANHALVIGWLRLLQDQNRLIEGKPAIRQEIEKSKINNWEDELKVKENICQLRSMLGFPEWNEEDRANFPSGYDQRWFIVLIFHAMWQASYHALLAHFLEQAKTPLKVNISSSSVEVKNRHHKSLDRPLESDKIVSKDKEVLEDLGKKYAKAVQEPIQVSGPNKDGDWWKVTIDLSKEGITRNE